MSEAYCALANAGDPLHGPYHDREYGFPSRDDSVLFERLVLEIAQAGLSWATILKRRAGYVTAYEGFEVARVAAYGEAEIARLLADAGIIRNRLKVLASIENARRIERIIGEGGSFANWLDKHHPLPLDGWVRLFRRSFKFTGPEIVNEFLMSLGYLPGAHVTHCPVYTRTLAADPPWRRAALLAPE